MNALLEILKDIVKLLDSSYNETSLWIFSTNHKKIMKISVTLNLLVF